MELQNIILFEAVKEKALALKRPYANSRLNDLLSLINEKEKQTFYLGFGHVKDTHMYYLLTLCQDQALIGVKSDNQREEEYIFLDLSLDDQGKLENFVGLYSTLIKQKEKKFNFQMGSIVMNSPRDQQMVLQGILNDAFGARDDSGLN